MKSNLGAKVFPTLLVALGGGFSEFVSSAGHSSPWNLARGGLDFDLARCGNGLASRGGPGMALENSSFRLMD